MTTFDTCMTFLWTLIWLFLVKITKRDSYGALQCLAPTLYWLKLSHLYTIFLFSFYFYFIFFLLPRKVLVCNINMRYTAVRVYRRIQANLFWFWKIDIVSNDVLNFNWSCLFEGPTAFSAWMCFSVEDCWLEVQHKMFYWGFVLFFMLRRCGLTFQLDFEKKKEKKGEEKKICSLTMYLLITSLQSFYL